ncbi:YitT family protein [Bacillus sp. V3B]|uniref:YczE/YyaS/YitT family protein n=1 Tax=Bacillus sp. V3B TaxID=2804915 RepID=UPI00210DD460|nr:YitT family protein [Bacillus sp. V3B]MCQ6273575.1 YitT family protein [Bacillus sp. V3B]
MHSRKNRSQTGPRFIIYLLGLLVMSLGIVLIILADLGPSPWDVLHVGLYYRVGLTIGSWSIIVGLIILIISALLSKSIPQSGAFINMILVGLFIDMFLMIPFLQTPTSFFGKTLMFAGGLLINCYGMGLYISAQLGAGPRDSLMLAITSKTGWKVGRVRSVIEVLAFTIGWQLGGPIFWGTIVYGILIGVFAGYSIPQCQNLTDMLLRKLQKEPHPEMYQTYKEMN